MSLVCAVVHDVLVRSVSHSPPAERQYRIAGPFLVLGCNLPRGWEDVRTRGCGFCLLGNVCEGGGRFAGAADVVGFYCYVSLHEVFFLT